MVPALRLIPALHPPHTGPAAPPLRSLTAPPSTARRARPDRAGRDILQQQRPAVVDRSSSEDTLSSPASPRHLAGQRPEEAEAEEEEEILSIQELDHYMRCLRRPGDVRPVQIISDRDGGAPTSPTRCAAQSQGSPAHGPSRSPAGSQPVSPARAPPDGRAAPAPSQSGPCRPAAAGAAAGAQPAVQVVGSPARTAPPPPLSRSDSTELPAELDLLYRQALDQLRAGDQTT